MQELRNPHPAAFPVALIDRIVQSTTASTILDPFIGSGTTAISALSFGRNFVGIDLSPEYCELGRGAHPAAPLDRGASRMRVWPMASRSTPRRR